MSKPIDRADIFKTALSAATRALAEHDDVEVDYSVDGGRVAEHTITLSTPPRELTALTAARARGQADALALRLAHHDIAQHFKLQPKSEEGRRLFEAAERARVESIGAAKLDGVADNLDAVLVQRCERAGYNKATDRQRAPLEDAVEFMLRERLTGRPLPQIAEGVANAWRAELTSKAETTLSRAVAAMESQGEFAKVMHELLRDLGMADETSGSESESEEEGEEEFERSQVERAG